MTGPRPKGRGLRGTCGRIINERDVRVPGAPAPPSLPRVYLTSIVALAGLGVVPMPPGDPPGGERPPKAPFSKFLNQPYRLSEKRKSSKTFNNGSLGSGIDEERSEMR